MESTRAASISTGTAGRNTIGRDAHLRPVLIGLAGGSGCGKTYLARQIRERSRPGDVSLLSMDQYFRTESRCDAANVNFDHPAHLDLELLIGHLQLLRSGKPARVPAYDFRTMRQTAEAATVEPAPVIVIEGLFVLAKPVVDLLDLTCFLDVADDQRLLGRILRDVEERDATVEHIVDRYQRFIRPSYNVFVAPTKQNAHIVVDFTYRRELFKEMLVEFVNDYVGGRIEISDYLARLNRESYRIGFRAEESVMPLSIDIRELAKAMARAVPTPPPDGTSSSRA